MQEIVDLPDHDGSSKGLKLGGTLVTTAAELNADTAATTVVNSKGVIYGASGQVRASRLEIDEQMIILMYLMPFSTQLAVKVDGNVVLTLMMVVLLVLLI